MYTSRYIRRSWIEVDLAQLAKNIELCRASFPADAKVMAIIKADAYGHGDAQIAKELSRLGISFFGVSNIDEAIVLRQSGVSGEILILGYTPIEMIPELLQYDIAQAILSEEYAEKVFSCSNQIKCHIAIDTGMNRIGIKAENEERCAGIVRQYSKRCQFMGIFTHLSSADSDTPDDVAFTQKQLARFERVAELVADLHPQYVHCLNSAGGLSYATECRYNQLVRLGIIMYGLKPSSNIHLPQGIRPILSWKTVVSMVKEIDKGEAVGYGRSFVATQKMKIATLPTGYADGYPRGLSNGGSVFVNGKKAPVIGKICMDQMMIDVTHIDNVAMGDEVTLLDQQYTADDMAQCIGTIGYEIVCGISKRVPRIYGRDASNRKYKD